MPAAQSAALFPTKPACPFTQLRGKGTGVPRRIDGLFSVFIVSLTSCDLTCTALRALMVAWLSE